MRPRRLKEKGDLAELMVACDLLRRGCKLAIPYGEDCDYDLVIERDGKLERVQVKHTESDGAVISVKCCSHSLTNGRVRATKRYTAATIDWLAVYDRQRIGATTFQPASSAMAVESFASVLHRRRTTSRRISDTRATTSTCARGSRRWSQPDSNRRPSGCKPDALPAELWPLSHSR